MAKNANDKTNAMRILEQSGVPFEAHYYTDSDAVSGLAVAQIFGQDPARVFKTLVTTGKSGDHFVFVIPSDKELDLKKAAKAVNEKAIVMLKQKELFPLTGYIHGGCSPVGMKKFFRTTFDESAILWDRIYFSGGKVGYQVELSIEDLSRAIPFELADLCTD